MLPDYIEYREKLAEQSILWGDQYALTMAQAFHTNGKHNLNTTFHAYIRKAPFNGTFLLTGGQNIIFDWLEKNWEFTPAQIKIMQNKTIPDPATGQPVRLYTDAFIEMCRTAKLELTIHAMPEGELAFVDEPIYRVHGPLWQCLMVEAAILNATNSQSLFATLASRLVEIADGAPIMEFGLRRAQCIGGLESTRGSFIGGVIGTSNMQAEELYGIPTSGTMAHAFVMTYEDELDAFRDYIGAMPYNGIFLVDTYDTLNGVKKAIQACQEKGLTLKGIRLDSGDLAYLSKEARILLDEAGFPNAKIVASNDLDEATIAELNRQGAKIDIYGVGTNLVTSKAQPALGAVYKLGAVFDGDLSMAEIDAVRQLVQAGESPANDNFYRQVIKLSEDAIKTSLPGELDVLRYIFKDKAGKARFDGDTILSNWGRVPLIGAAPGEDYGRLSDPVRSVRKNDDTRVKIFPAGTLAYSPLQLAFDAGARVAPFETVHDAQARAAVQLGMLASEHKRPLNPHTYVAGIEEGLFDSRKRMMRDIRAKVA